MSEYIDFTSEIPWDKMEILLKLGNEFYFDPSSSIESEEYFLKLLSKYQGCDDDLVTLLRADIKKDFKVLDKKPDWLQDPEWQFNNGRPMEFVGQLEIGHDKNGLYDDAVFYVFWDREMGITKTIIQTA
ncbi:MAG: hypothetical protein HDT39_06545 [Lachnospiraceae bacterium]|nr:hypothetical protein [Lachnospiraceae bacterium]